MSLAICGVMGAAGAGAQPQEVHSRSLIGGQRPTPTWVPAPIGTSCLPSVSLVPTDWDLPKAGPVRSLCQPGTGHLRELLAARSAG